MKVIYETSDYPDVLIKKGMLEQAGFLVYVDNLNSAAAMPELGFTVGYRILVPEDDAEVAIQLIRDQLPNLVDDEEEEVTALDQPGTGTVFKLNRSAVAFVLIFFLVWLLI